MNWRLGPVIVVAMLAGCRSAPFDLPAHIHLERVVADLSGTFTHDAVESEVPTDPVRAGGIQPGLNIELNRGYRQALLAPPPAAIRFRTHVPADARLRFGVAVAGTGKRDTSANGLRFAVDVDGREAYARTVNPAATRYDRAWFDADVPLGPRERDAEIVLRTAVAGRGDHLAGTPGWSHVRIVRDEWRDRQAAAVERPNVLVLLVDTFRADELGHWTPTLDALAATGRTFTRVEAAASWTLPAVASIFTGLYPRSHGVVGPSPDGQHADAVDPAFLSDALVTVAEIAQHAGITTVGVSSNPLVSRATNFAQGFETFVETGWDRERRNWKPASAVNDAFLRWLRANRGYRFFGYLHYMEPHDPYTPTHDRPAPPGGAPQMVADGDAEAVSKRLNRGPIGTLPGEQLAYLRRLYDLEVREWDAELSRLLSAMTNLGVRQSTLVVVLADHGEEFLEHGRIKHGMHLYEELLHVPLVIAGPGISAGRVDEPVQSVDLLPTIAGLLGGETPAGLPGQSLLAAREPRPAFSETRDGIADDGRSTQLFAVRSGNWKLIRSPDLGTSELYDLARDPGEHENRFGSTPEGDRLAALLDEWQAHAPPPPPVGGRDPDLGTKLRALGYVD